MRFDSLDDWLAWQEQLHPRAIDLGLERVATVYRRLHAATPSYRIVTVGGTNGKGSCVAMLEGIYRAAGYRVGTYISPHLWRYNERIRVNGEEVSDQALCRAFERIDQARGEISLTYFEFGTLAALDIFNGAGLDMVLLEVGLGGRLDAVNIMDADVALISSIGLDHQDWLGPDREAIAREKAGIMRPGRPVVCGDGDPPRSLLDTAAELQAPLYRQGIEFTATRQGTAWQWRGPRSRRHALPLPALRGDYQLQNASSVLMVVELLADRLPVSQNDVRTGLATALIPGRFQVIPGEVTQILDVAHNPDAAAALACTLKGMPSAGTTHAVVAMLRDKDITGVLRAMAEVVDVWYPAGLAVARGASCEVLCAALRSAGIEQAVNCSEQVSQACRQALAQAVPGDRIVIFGSFYTVAQADCQGV